MDASNLKDSGSAGPAAAAPPGRVDLGATCTIQEVGPLRARLLEVLEAGRPCEIDGAAVERADAVGLQLLVAFALDCMERNVSFAWVGRSPALEEGIELLGLAALLESPGVFAFAPPATGP